MALEIAEKFAQSDLGQQRTGNEDSFLEQAPLFVVADGMGGARAGEIASGMAVETLGTFEPGKSIESALVSAAKDANRKIWESSQADDELAGMGTTLSAVFFDDGEITIGHVGDSRVYRLRDDDLEQLTHDHSLVGELVRQGKLKPEEAETHPQRSIITRALGPESDVEVDTFTYAVRDGDVYLVCSDGLTGMVSDDGVARILRGRSSLEAAAQELIDAANANGGRDNITVVLFRIAAGVEDLDEDAGTLIGAPAVTVEAPAQDTKVVDRAGSGEVTRERECPEDEEGDVEEETAGGDAEGEDEETGDEERPAAKDSTLLMDAESAAKARSESGARAAPPPPRRRRRKRVVVIAIILLVATALAAGLYAGSRQFYFVGTNADGRLTVYQGLPYDLPLGIELYSEEFVSTVPALSLPQRRRDRVLDHQLRERGDAMDLLRELERARAR